MEEKLLDSLRSCRVGYAEALYQLKSKDVEIAYKDSIIVVVKQAHFDCYNDSIAFLQIAQIFCLVVIFLLLTAAFFRKISLFFTKIKQILWRKR